MPNDCNCKVRVTANEDTIKRLRDTEFSFKVLHTPPEFPPLQDLSGEDTRWWEWNIENWGTKWDRYNFRFEHKGSRGLMVSFTTAWDPPYSFFQHLLETFPDLWLHCEWMEEGGEAGVFVGYTKEGEVEIKELHWPDWCLEMRAFIFDDDDEMITCARTLEECGSKEEYEKELKNPSLRITLKEWRERRNKKMLDFLNLSSILK